VWTGLVNATAVVLICIGTLLAVVVANPDGPAPFVTAPAAVTGYLLIGGPLVHEAGHLLAAVLLRLPVTAVRVRLIRGTSQVEVDWSAARRWLPPRMVAVFAAGPLVESLVAAGAYRGFRLSEGPAAQAALLALAVAAGVTALWNLVPHRMGHALRSDGANIFRSLRPSLVRRRHPAAVDARPLGIADTAGSARLNGLRAVVDRGGDPAAVGAAALALLDEYTRWTSTPIGPDAARLAGVARSADVDPAVAAEVAARLAWAQSRVLLRNVVLLSTAPAAAHVAGIVELAEIGHRLDPTAPQARYSLAMARLWQGSVAEARELCRDADPPGSATAATGLLLRALVELWSSGGTAAAASLLDEAVRAGCPPEVVWLAGRLPSSLHTVRRA
jgi:hypothetical protein